MRLRGFRMLRLAWTADLHLDHAGVPAREACLDVIASMDADALVIAGDVGTACSVEAMLVDIASAFRQRPVYFVLGNHDYYGGSVVEVRERMAALCARVPNLTYLWDAEVVPLTERTALVGVDGWGDARYGNWSSTTVALSDFRLVSELAWAVGRAELTQGLRAFGDDSAYRLRPRLDAALSTHERVVVATHVPPYPDCAWHDGRPADDDWSPYFACRAVGDVLLDAAARHPGRSILVLTGHSHGGGAVDVRPTLRVLTADAEYGAPRLQPTLLLP